MILNEFLNVYLIENDIFMEVRKQVHNQVLNQVQEITSLSWRTSLPAIRENIRRNLKK